MRLIDKDALLKEIRQQQHQDTVCSNFNNYNYAVYEKAIKIIENQPETKFFISGSSIREV